MTVTDSVIFLEFIL